MMKMNVFLGVVLFYCVSISSGELQRYTMTVTGVLTCDATPDVTADIVMMTEGLKKEYFMGKAITNATGHFKLVGYVTLTAQPAVKVIIYTKCDNGRIKKGGCYRMLTEYPPHKIGDFHYDMREKQLLFANNKKEPYCEGH